MSLTNRVLRIGVLGNSSISNRMMIPAIRQLADLFELAGVASRNFDTAETLSRTLGTPRFVGYDSLVSDSSVDAIYIPLPNSLHYQFAAMALKEGKHVLVEKPMCLDLQEAIKLVQLARDRGLVLLESFQFRFHSQLNTILNLVADGYIGDLRLIRSSFGFPPFASPDNIRYKRNLGGGALLDAGVYSLKLATLFLGENASVEQSTGFSPDCGSVDLWGTGTLLSSSRSLACQFSYGFDNYYQCKLELWGSLGLISTDRIFTAPCSHAPILNIFRKNSAEVRTLDPDDHFRNLLVHFYHLVSGVADKELEFNGNIEQARLVHSLREAQP